MRRCNRQAHGIRVANVFRGRNDKSSRDKPRIFSGLQHPREPIQGRVRIAAADALDERTRHVVMIIACRIKSNHSALHRFFRHRAIHMLRCSTDRQHRDLQSRQRAATVAVRQSRDERQSFVVDSHAHVTKTTTFVGKGSLHQTDEIVSAQFAELKDLTATDQRRDEREERIRRRRANQRDRSVLHIRQQDVLLAATEAMQLINEQNRLSSVGGQSIGRVQKQFTNFFDASGRCVQAFEMTPRMSRDQFRQSRLAGPGRSVENHRADTICIQHATQQLSVFQNMFLPGEL